MSILLDTHAALWFHANDSRLSPAARDAITLETQSVYISPASYWELAIKISLRKFALTLPFEQFWQGLIELNNLSVLPIEIRHAATLSSLPFLHRDPFDRMLVAQALTDNLRLVSADATLDDYGITRIW